MKTIISKISIVISLFLICSLTACENEYEPSGGFGVAFKVDGEFFKARSDDWKKYKATSAVIKKDTLAVRGTYSIGSYHSAGFRIVDFSGPGTYTLNSSDVNYGGYYTGGRIKAYTTDIHSGVVVITHHYPSKRMIAGSFSFTAFNNNAGTTYEITDGKFDVFYATGN